MIKNTSSKNDPQRHGFHMTFQNGWTASIQWGRGMYCDTRDSGDASSPTAEIACWPKSGGLHPFAAGDTVSGWVKADQVARFLTFVSAIDPASPPDVIDLAKI